MNDIDKLSVILEDKIPSIKYLKDYSSLNNFTLCNRNDNNSIVCTLSNLDFKQFINKNNIVLPENKISLFNNIKDIGFDLSSLFTNQYRFYISYFTLRLYSLWEYAKGFPIEYVEVEKLKHIVNANIDRVTKQNRHTKWYKNVELSDTSYPVVVARDHLGSYSLIDGAHRVKKIIDLSEKTIKAYVIPLIEFSSWNQRRMTMCISESSILDSRCKDLYNKVKDKIDFENKKISDQITIEKLECVGFYYNKITNDIDTWKFYFRAPRDSRKVIHHKFDNIGNYKGTFVEEVELSPAFYKDQMNVISKIQEAGLQITSSSSRTDIDQTYLGIKI